MSNLNNRTLEMHQEFIINELNKYKELLDKQIKKSTYVNQIIIDENFLFNIDCKTKEEMFSIKVKKKLEEIKKSPALYWITFDNESFYKKDVYDSYVESVTKNLTNEFKIGKDYYHENDLKFRRVFSSYKSKNENDFNTQSLYVGKVENNLWGRLAVHCGWGTSPKTAGLQLRYWYDFHQYGNLTFNYLVFDNQFKYFVEVLEKELRNKINPLIGKK